LTLYTAEFFASQYGRSLGSARVILGELFKIYSPQSVVDVGCGVAPWLRAAQELGVGEVAGLDGDYVDRSHLLIDPSCFIACDLETARLAGVVPGQTFDLVLCMEVAEHLSEPRAASFVEDLTALGSVILFSAAIPFQGGEHHINEQWPEYWALLFRGLGYDCADFLRELVWADPKVDWWYAQNTLIFFRKNHAVAERLAPLAVPLRHTLARVHPGNYLDQILKWFHTYRYEAAAEEYADLHTLLQAYQSGATRLPLLQALARATANPGASDVFPRTRSEQSVPEEVQAALQSRIKELQRELDESKGAAVSK